LALNLFFKKPLKLPSFSALTIFTFLFSLLTFVMDDDSGCPRIPAAGLLSVRPESHQKGVDTSPLLSPLRCGEGKEVVYESEKYVTSLYSSRVSRMSSPSWPFDCQWGFRLPMAIVVIHP
jgi:hypothetical protein